MRQVCLLGSGSLSKVEWCVLVPFFHRLEFLADTAGNRSLGWAQETFWGTCKNSRYRPLRCAAMDSLRCFAEDLHYSISAYRRRSLEALSCFGRNHVAGTLQDSFLWMYANQPYHQNERMHLSGCGFRISGHIRPLTSNLMANRACPGKISHPWPRVPNWSIVSIGGMRLPMHGRLG